MYGEITEAIRRLIEQEIMSNLSITTFRDSQYKNWIQLSYHGSIIGGPIPIEV